MGLTFNKQAAQCFIARMYDPAVGLFREAPNAAPNHYWYYNDLYIAQLALHGMPSGAADISWPQLPLPRVRVLSGDTFKDGTVTAPDSIIVLASMPHLIRTETPNLAAQPYPVTLYADIAFYNIIHLFNQGQLTKARQALTQAEKIWDGNGWKDQGFNEFNKYETYKNALYLISCKRLGVTGTYQQQNMAALQACQVFNRPGYANQEGGVSTHYLPNRPWEGDTNVETTALCTLAGAP